MKINWKKIGAMVGVVLMLTGCTGNLSGSTENLMKDVRVSRTESVCDESFGAAARSFALSLFQQMNAAENTLISPVSAMTALGMTVLGARSKTAAQMYNLFGMDADTLHASLRAWRAQLPSGKSTAEMAQSMWFRTGFSVCDDFLTQNAQYYDAGVFRAPFDQSTVSDINRWTSGKTKDRIPKLLDQLPTGAQMVLINALAFDGKWDKPFETDGTFDEIFTRADGTEQSVPMMHGKASHYIETDHAYGFRKSYTDGYAWIAVLPKAGNAAELADALNEAEFAEMLTAYTPAEVQVTMPKFRTEYTVRLNDALKALGMTDAFTVSADFSGISPDPLCIDEVLQKTFMETDESGTKAAAATAVIGKATACAPGETVEVVLDQPFLYFVVDSENVPLFCGVMQSVNP